MAIDQGAWVALSSLFYAGFVLILGYLGLVRRYYAQCSGVLAAVLFSTYYHFCYSSYKWCPDTNPVVAQARDIMAAFLAMQAISIFYDQWFFRRMKNDVGPTALATFYILTNLATCALVITYGDGLVTSLVLGITYGVFLLLSLLVELGNNSQWNLLTRFFDLTPPAEGGKGGSGHWFWKLRLLVGVGLLGTGITFHYLASVEFDGALLEQSETYNTRHGLGHTFTAMGSMVLATLLEKIHKGTSTGGKAQYKSITQTTKA